MEISEYQFTWIEFHPTKGKALKCDIEKIGGFYSADLTDNHYRCFATKKRALDFLTSFNKKLKKRYECRLFSDKQFGMIREDNGYKVPFTQKQFNEVYYL